MHDLNADRRAGLFEDAAAIQGPEVSAGGGFGPASSATAFLPSQAPARCRW
jgi:hypothetical protein